MENKYINYVKLAIIVKSLLEEEVVLKPISKYLGGALAENLEKIDELNKKYGLSISNLYLDENYILIRELMDICHGKSEQEIRDILEKPYFEIIDNLNDNKPLNSFSELNVRIS